MKGKTVCPNCKEKFVIDLPKDEKKHEITCPNCKYKFNVKPGCKNKDKDECSWEEYGEPRKTILSSIKPKTKKPFIALIILMIVFSIGITTAIFSETFIETNLQAASNIGLNGEIKLKITDQDNNSLDNITIVLNGETIGYQSAGIYHKSEVELGIQKIKLTGNNYKSQEIEVLILPLITTELNVIMQDGSGDAETTYYETLGCSFIIIIFSVFALISMIACMKRQHFDLAVIGSFLAIFSFGFFFICSIISIVAFVLIILSRDEFENGVKGKIF